MISTFQLLRQQMQKTESECGVCLADICSSTPGEGEFMNIVWDAAIEHFTEQEIDNMLFDIKRRLTSGGVLSGYTIVERHDGNKHIHQHEYEFHDKEDLLRSFHCIFSM